MRILSLAVGVISLTVGVQTLTVFAASQFVIRSHDLSVEISSQGQIVGVLLGNEKIKWNVQGQTKLTGCRVEGPVDSEKGNDGVVRFKMKLLCDSDQTRREVRLVEVFSSTRDSVRWEMELDGKGRPGVPGLRPASLSLM
jgi:hypothetical protein